VKLNHRQYGSSVVSFGTYTCCGGSVPAGPEQLAQRMVVSVTRRGTYGLQRGDDFEIVDHARAVLFNAGDVFRTSHPDRCDDSGFYLSFHANVVVDILGRHDARVAEHPERPFRELTVPMSPRATLLAAGLFRDHRAFPGRADGRLEFDERAFRWLDALFAAAPVPSRARPARAAPSPAHRDLANEARRLLALHFREPLGLQDLAAALGVSSFHLCRVFRSVTGASLHRQLEDHRLAAALDAVNDPSRDLSRIAFDCGFSSHSHFTARFRRSFGVTPSHFRRARS
jgi:AraC-like DNA-binding protein